jgi:hypothetical protein
MRGKDFEYRLGGLKEYRFSGSSSGNEGMRIVDAPADSSRLRSAVKSGRDSSSLGRG